MRIPLTTYGRKEISLFGGGFLAASVLLVVLGPPWLAPLPALGLLAVLLFFRDPERAVPQEPGVVVAPADGKVVAIDEVEQEEFIDGPATRVDIFLAVYDVHVNRAAVAGEVKYKTDRPGRHANALRPEAGAVNHAHALGLVTDEGGHRVLIRQIVGAIARRIVCAADVGDRLARGQRYGMMKFGSRTQVAFARAAGFRARVKVGETVRAGRTVLGTLDKKGRDS